MSIEEKQYCFGCGVELQCDNPDESGYVPEEVYKRKNTSLCRRCFRLQHYHEDDETVDVKGDYIKILHRAKRTKSLVVYVVDFFTYSFSFIDAINDAIKGLDIIIVANKRDILPKSLKDDRLERNIRHLANEKGLKVVSIILTSASKNYHIDELLRQIEEYRKGRNVYFVGAVSVGKSSLINTLLKNYANETSKMITTSPYPGTTIDVIEVPLDNKSYIYDTPGLPLETSLISKVERKTVLLLTPQKEMKSRVYQINDQQSLILGGMGRIDFIKGKRTNFTIYASNEVQIQRTKLEKSKTTFYSLIKNRAIKPLSEYLVNEEDFERKEYNLISGGYEIGISGLGWIHFKSSDITIVLIVPKGVEISIKKVN